MEILVTGGTGFLGRHLATKLLSSGHRVHLLGRNFAQVEQLLAAGAIRTEYACPCSSKWMDLFTQRTNFSQSSLH